MTQSVEIPDCFYSKEPTLVCPSATTPRHSLYLSNLDDQKFLRFSIKYLYVYKRSIKVEALRDSLSRALVEYYPLAGRLRSSGEGGEKLEVDCNAEGAVLAEGYMDLSVEEFLQGSRKPNRSWRKLLYRVEAQSFFGIPPLVIQVTYLNCGGMILCTAINHSLCDGIGSAQFLHSWAQFRANPDVNLLVTPFHSRRMLRPRWPCCASLSHPEYACLLPPEHASCLTNLLQSQPLVPISVTFTSSEILQLKKLCVPSLKCTSFETLASHVWRSWAKSLDLPPFLRIKLLFSMNVRKKLKPELPCGFYGNGFVLACAEATVNKLIMSNAHYGTKLVQEAKNRIDDEYVRSMIDFLEERRVKPDLSATLVISEWSKLGLERLDFGEGRPLHMGPLASEIYCLFLPVIGDLHATTVLISVPQGAAEKFEHCLKNIGEREVEEDCGKENFGGKGYLNAM